MIHIMLALLPIALIIVLAELFWRRGATRGERSRKLVHVLAGVWIAFWPQFLDLDVIFILGVITLNVVLYARAVNILRSIHSVTRKSYGDILFAVALIVAAYFASDGWIFTVAILLMALADGGAAVAGKLWGRSTEYYVFAKKHLKKSLVGTITFVALCYVSLGIGWLMGGDMIIGNNAVITLLFLPIAATILENTSPYGLDNAITPIFTVILLNSLT